MAVVNSCFDMCGQVLERCNPLTYFRESFYSFSISLLFINDERKVRIMSSRYVLYMLGYPYDTMAITKRGDVLKLS
jgi:hypothetical protein